MTGLLLIPHLSKKQKALKIYLYASPSAKSPKLFNEESPGNFISPSFFSHLDGMRSAYSMFSGAKVFKSEANLCLML